MTFLQLLKENDFTQSALARSLATEFGHYKYQQQISEWCKGVRKPDIESVYYMSQILGVSCDDIIRSLLEEGA